MEDKRSLRVATSTSMARPIPRKICRALPWFALQNGAAALAAHMRFRSAMAARSMFRPTAIIPPGFFTDAINTPGGYERGYWLLDASTHYQMANGFEFALIGRNLTNKYYYQRTSGVTFTGTASGLATSTKPDQQGVCKPRARNPRGGNLPFPLNRCRSPASEYRRFDGRSPCAGRAIYNSRARQNERHRSYITQYCRQPVEDGCYPYYPISIVIY